MRVKGRRRLKTREPTVAMKWEGGREGEEEVYMPDYEWDGAACG